MTKMLAVAVVLLVLGGCRPDNSAKSMAPTPMASSSALDRQRDPNARPMISTKDQPVSLKQFVFLKFVRHSVLPESPADFVAQRVGGRVVADVVVDPQGLISAVRVVESTHPGLSKAVETAVQKWELKPANVRGSSEPHFAKATLTFYFEPGKATAVIHDDAEAWNAR